MMSPSAPVFSTTNPSSSYSRFGPSRDRPAPWAASGRSRFLEVLGHQVLIVIDEAEFPVQSLRRRVRTLDLEMERPHLEVAAHLLHDRHRLPPDSATAPVGTDEQLVHEGVAAAIHQ